MGLRHVTLADIIGTIILVHVFKSSLYNLFKDRVPVDLINYVQVTKLYSNEFSVPIGLEFLWRPS